MRIEYKYNTNITSTTKLQTDAIYNERILIKYVRKYFKEVYDQPVTIVYTMCLSSEDQTLVDDICLNVWYKNRTEANMITKKLNDLGIVSEMSYGVSKRRIWNKNCIKLLELIEAKYHNMIYN